MGASSVKNWFRSQSLISDWTPDGYNITSLAGPSLLEAGDPGRGKNPLEGDGTPSMDPPPPFAPVKRYTRNGISRFVLLILRRKGKGAFQTALGRESTSR